MKTELRSWGMLLALSLLFSCSGSPSEKRESPKEEVPVALQDDKPSLKSYARSGDLTEDLYEELVEQQPALRKLEDDFEAYYPKLDELKKKYDQYDAKSNNYYASAHQKALTITDSLLKKKVNALIAASKDKYTSRSAAFNSLLQEISHNNTAMSDYHTVLKVVLTLPVMEKFQEEKQPDKKDFRNLIKEQKKLISQTDSLSTVR
jgi:hypothetical protein